MLPSLPPNARVWLFTPDRILSSDDQDSIVAQAKSFASTWMSHGRPVHGEVELLHGCVLVVGACIEEEGSNAGISGCGIDGLVHAVEATAVRLGFSWTRALDVAYYDDDEVLRTVSRSEFRRLARDGHITPESVVLDLSSTSVGDLRRRGVKLRAADSWHISLLPLAQAV